MIKKCQRLWNQSTVGIRRLGPTYLLFGQRLKVFVGIYMAFCFLYCSSSYAASDFAGTVRAIELHKALAGMLIQLDGAPVFEAGSACPMTWAFVSINDPFFNHFLAIATTAKATGETVHLFTSGCISAPVIGLMPSVFAFDYGMRTPGT